MTKKVRIMIIVIAVATAVILATGITLAVTTSDNSSTGTVTLGQINLSAKATNFKVYSAVRAAESDSAEMRDENGLPYVYEQSTIQSGNTLSFKNGGSVSYSENEVAIDGFMPGDKVEFDIEVKSDSNLAFNYRTELRVDKTFGDTLLNQLNFKAGDLQLRHIDLNASAGTDNFVTVAATDWKAISTNKQDIEKVSVTVEFPITATAGQGQSTTLRYVAKGEQNDETLPDIAEIVDGTETVSFKYLQDAVNYAYEKGIDTVKVSDSNVIEEGEVTVRHGVKFVGQKSSDGKNPVLNGVRFNFDDAAATFSDIDFAGESFIDVTRCLTLGLENCNVNVLGTKYFDSESRTFLNDEAFIVSANSLISPQISVKNSTFNVNKGAVVNMRSNLADGSVFAANTFGSAEKPLDGSAVLILGGAEQGARVSVSNNAFYGVSALSFNGEADVAFWVISDNNRAFVSGTFANGKAAVALCDNGSEVNGNAIVNANIASDDMLFAATNVRYSNLGYVTAGTFALQSITVDEFFVGYADKAQLAQNAITLLNDDGVAYAHLNSDGNGEYTIDNIA